MTPQSMMEVARQLAMQLIVLPEQEKLEELRLLRDSNKELHALVAHQFRKLRNAAKTLATTEEATTMGKDTPKYTEDCTLCFEYKGKTIEVYAVGFEYCHEMASGLMTFECLSGSKKIINALMTLFGDANKGWADLRVRRLDGVTTVFPAPNVLITINYSYPGKNDTLVLQGVQFRFVREVVTIYPKGMEPKDESLE
jgi:hypothetical protein